MSLIGETLLSAAITTLFDKLASSDVLQFARQEQVDADLHKWKKILVKIQAVLDDAEEKQTTNQLVEIWLGDLKNLAYDVEDILDEFATEALRRKLEEPDQASTSRVHKLILTCCTGLSPLSIKLNSTAASQIKEITTRLQQIVEDKNSFGLMENAGARSDQARYHRPPATSLNEPNICGRDKDKEAILKLLLKVEGTHAKFSVVSIQGMGGIGKTTLAQLVYNDPRVKAHFDITAWTCVSDDFNATHLTQVTKTILQSITLETYDVNDLNILQVKLKEKLSGKKFFIVLDDVWSDDYNLWTNLCLPFEAGSFGSKIVVTTRLKAVSSTVRALVTYPLKELPNNHCWSVFTYHVGGEIDFNKHQDLKRIGETIVERCQGLPLAIKTLGGLLGCKIDSKHWEDVLHNIDSNTWDLQEEKSSIIRTLEVSYYYLPLHLKRCFIYCSMFPKDHVFHKDELILLWMAQGFLQSTERKTAEDFGERYFDDLLSRSFFQQSSYGFVMHDLINDLAQWAAKDFCFRFENLQEGKKQWEISENLRHLAFLIHGSNYDIIKEFGAFNKMKSVRTFLVLSPYSWQPNNCDDLLCKVFQLRRLRVLSLKKYPISKLPNSIGDMKLLHHLDLSYTEIEFLPDSINKLYNLEALVLKHCYNLKRLCSDMGNLIKLRHLNVFGVYLLEATPLRIGKLTSLQTLQRFIVGKDMRSGLKELKDLKHLQERLHISGLENVNDFVDAENANLNGKDGLKDIQLEWTSSNDVSNEKEIAAQVLEKLQPCQKLESLQIQGYVGARFPQWLDDVEAFPHLRKLSIRKCSKLEGKLPEHFPSLKSLLIEDCEQWRVYVPRLPEDCTIQIAKCKEVVLSSIKDCSSLSSMVHLLSGISSHMFLAEGFAEGFSKVEKLDIVAYDEPSSFLKCGFHSLQEYSMELSSKICPNLEIGFGLYSSHEERLRYKELPGRCQYLILEGCQCPVKLEQALLSLSFLRGITIRESKEIKFFPEAGLPSQLRFIDIDKCDALQSLPIAWMHSSNTFLEELSITNCDSLTCIDRVQLPSNLKRLVIKHCSNLLSVLDEEEVSGSCENTSCLEKLIIKSCPSLTSLWSSSGNLPKALRYLSIEVCSKLESIAKGFHVNMKLEKLYIFDCEKLETLPSSINNLISLKKVGIINCPAISIPEGGFPTSLTLLTIKDTKMCKSLFEWGLHRLMSLEILGIGGCLDVISFPQEETGMILPTSLTLLKIDDFPDLERLSSIAQNLTCLEKLYLNKCPKLKYFPDDGLPQSLKELGIEDCPLLEERCKEGEGLYWSMIAHLSKEYSGYDTSDPED